LGNLLISIISKKLHSYNLRHPIEAESENYAVQMYSDERPRKFIHVQASERQSMNLGERIEQMLKTYWMQKTLRYLAEQDETGACAIGRILSSYGRSDLPIWPKLKYAIPHMTINWLIKKGGGSRDGFRAEIRTSTSFRRAIITACRSIGEFGLVKPQVFSSPLIVIWNFTQACNLRCRHCYQNAGPRADDELSLEEKYHVIDELAANDVSMLAFSGGEPLVSPDFWPTLAYAKTKEFHISVATNGTLLTPETLDRMADNGVDYVEVSIDSVHPEKHDAFRGGHGYWARSIKGLENLARHKRLRASMASTITQLNFDELDDLITMAKDMGLEYFYLFNFIPTGRGKDIVDLDLTPEQREQMITFMNRHLNEGKIQVMGTAPQYGRKCLENYMDGQLIATGHYGSSGHNSTRVIARYIGGCAVGRCMMAIQPNGDVTPCVFMPVVFGSLRDKPLRRLWRENDLLGKFRDRSILGGNCGKCDWQLYCGGCRARAYGYFGDVTAADPGCVFNTPAWEQLKEETEKVPQTEPLKTKAL
jgi:radical SAM protein with 4Fe4S-binding SPASM domain